MAIGGPVHLATEIASGKRVDKALMGELQNAAADIKGVAPLAQSVVSMVPGLGTGVSAVIAGGLALASGKRIDDALFEAVKGAIPGGPLAQVALSIGHSAMTGKAIDSALLGALPIPKEAQKALASGLAIAKAAASGKRIDPAFIKTALDNLPGESRELVNSALAKGRGTVETLLGEVTKQLPDKALRQALTTGMTLGHARVLQSQGMGEHAAHHVDPATGQGFMGFAVRTSTPAQASLFVAQRLIEGLDSHDAIRKAAALRIVEGTRAIARAGNPDAERAITTLLAARTLHDMHKRSPYKFANLALHRKPLPLDPVKPHAGIVVTLHGKQVKGNHRIVGKGTPGANENAMLVLPSGMMVRGHFLQVS
jgi:hypothetical protein